MPHGEIDVDDSSIGFRNEGIENAARDGHMIYSPRLLRNDEVEPDTGEDLSEPRTRRIGQ